MNYHDVKRLMEDAPAMRIFRRQSAALVIGFLFYAFKREQPVGAIEAGNLAGLLDAYVADLRDGGEWAESFAETSRSSAILDSWTTREYGLLRKYLDDESDKHVFEMTADAERVVAWIESLASVEFVGTESKIKSLYRDIEQIVELATTNPDVRLAQLRRQAAEIQEKITKIEETQQVDGGTPVQINEWFQQAVKTARDLPGDFRTVEEKLQSVAQTIAEQLAKQETNRGEIMGSTLDAHESLVRSPQGQSFNGFWTFLLAPQNQEEFRSRIDLIYSIQELSEENRNNLSLDRLFSTLLREGQKVVRSQQRLSSALRRALDVAARRERQSLGLAIREIRGMSLQLRERLAGERDFIQIQDEPYMDSFMSRPEFEPSRNFSLTSDLKEAGQDGDLSVLREFAVMQPIALEQLRQNLRDLLADGTIKTLANVVDRYPPTNGIIEVLAYISIAKESTDHVIDDRNFEDIAIPTLPSDVRLKVPLIYFGAPQRSP